MNSVKLTHNFERQLRRIVKKYPGFLADMDALLERIKEDANLGTELFAGVRKVRLSVTGKARGKSGGARSIYYVQDAEATVWMLYVYDKAEVASIPENEIRAFVEEIQKSGDEDGKGK